MIDKVCIDERVRSHLPEVQLIVLFGSQAKGTATSKSDWDIAIRKTPGTYPGMQFFTLQKKIADALEISFDLIDLVDLQTASPLLSFAIAKEGIPLYEEIPGSFRVFQVRASKVYADTAKIRKLQRDYIRSD